MVMEAPESLRFTKSQDSESLICLFNITNLCHILPCKPHCHEELRYNHQILDPWPYLILL